MKKNDWYFLGLLSLYSALFYQQVPGLNLLIFTLAYVGVMLIQHYKKLNSKLIASAILCLLAGSSVFIYGNLLSFISSVVSIGIFSFLCFSAKNSIFASVFFALYNLMFSMFHIFVDGDRRISKVNKITEKKVTKTVGFILIPLLVVLIFVLLYRHANPVFKELTDQISFNFISFKFIGFTCLGAIVVYGIFYPKGIEQWHIYETRIPNKALHTDGWDQYLSRDSEHKLAIWIIALLNILILFVNLIDINYLFLGGEFPSHLTLAELLHQGVNTLIFSIVLAIIVVLVFFRGRLNYYENNRTLKILTSIWLGLNLLMALITMEKNHIYISEYGLTYKRIGVYVYLFLTSLGLIYTFIKVHKIRSNWFLVRQLGWYFWGTLVIAAFIPWNLLIANFNINKYLNEQKDIDLAYLYELGPDTFPILLNHETSLSQSQDSQTFLHLHKHIDSFIEHTDSKSWQSYNLNDDLVRMKLLESTDYEQ